MSTQAVPAPTPAITIDVVKDLASTSDLSDLLSSNSNVLFQLESALAAYAGQPVSKAAGQFSASVNLTAAPSWKAGPVTFSLTPSAKCTITIASQGEDFEAATDISDTTKTANVQLAPLAGMTYVNIDLDFDLTGNVAGSGTVYGITISGKASGSTDTTLTFCQPVPSGTETIEAITMALSDMVFPTSPNSALTRMVTGSSCRMTFDGTLNWELDVSYGLADYKLSAGSAGLLQQSFAAVSQSLTLPTAEIKAGATASVSYSHSDHFGLILTMPDANTAKLYLVRASADETDANVGISVGVTVTAASVKVDPAGIQSAIRKVTNSSSLATTVVNAVTPQVNNVEATALTNLNAWIKKFNGDAGIGVALANMQNRAALFNYQVDLTRPATAAQSWNDLFTSNVADATNISGFTLIPGSGVSEQISKGTTLQFHFFDLYKYSNSATFFDNCRCELAADGTIRIISDVGVHNLIVSNSSKVTVWVHFSAVATQGPGGVISNPAIDLNIEMSENGDARAAALLGGVLSLVNQQALAPAIAAMSSYAAATPAGTVGFVATLHSSAYGRLVYSPFINGIDGTPRIDQSADKINWNAIHSAAVTLMGQNSQFVTPWTFEDWSVFNSYENTTGRGAVANRRRRGPITAVPSSFWKGNIPQMVAYFLNATAQGMNLFEDLATLAADLMVTTSDAQWKVIQSDLAAIVNGDLKTDYVQPISAAILSQAAAAANSQLTVATAEAKDSSTFTTTLTIS